MLAFLLPPPRATSLDPALYIPAEVACRLLTPLHYTYLLWPFMDSMLIIANCGSEGHFLPTVPMSGREQALIINYLVTAGEQVRAVASRMPQWHFKGGPDP